MHGLADRLSAAITIASDTPSFEEIEMVPDVLPRPDQTRAEAQICAVQNQDRRHELRPIHGNPPFLSTPLARRTQRNASSDPVVCGGEDPRFELQIPQVLHLRIRTDNQG